MDTTMRSQSADGPRKLPRLEPADVLTATFPHLKRSAAVEALANSPPSSPVTKGEKKVFRPTATAAAALTNETGTDTVKFFAKAGSKHPTKFVCLVGEDGLRREAAQRAAMYEAIAAKAAESRLFKGEKPLPPKKLTPLPVTQKEVRDRVIQDFQPYNPVSYTHLTLPTKRIV